MSRSLPGPDPAEALIHLAYVHGRGLSCASARDLCKRLGYAAAADHVVMASRLVDLAATRGARLDFAVARRLVARAHEDFAVAVSDLSAWLSRDRPSPSALSVTEVQQRAEAYGFLLSASTARRWIAGAVPDADAHIRDLGRVRDAAVRLGVRTDLKAAAARLSATNGDADVAVARVERQEQKMRLRSSHLCRMRHRPATSAERIEAAARCGCNSCFYRLADDLASRTRMIIHRYAGPRRAERDEDDLRQEAWIVLLLSLLSWSGGCSFAAYYGGNLHDRFGRLAQHDQAVKRSSGEPPLSLDAPLAYLDEGPVTIMDRIPVDSIDPLDALLLKERIVMAIAADRRQTDEIWRLFEAKVAFT